MRRPAGDFQNGTETVFPFRFGAPRRAAQPFPIAVSEAARRGSPTWHGNCSSVPFWGSPTGRPTSTHSRPPARNGTIVSVTFLGSPAGLLFVTIAGDLKMCKHCLRLMLGVPGLPDRCQRLVLLTMVGSDGKPNTCSLQHVRYALPRPADEQSRRAGSALFRMGLHRQPTCIAILMCTHSVDGSTPGAR